MKKSLFMIFAAAALVSCSESEINNPIDGEDVQITLRSNTIDASGEATRAPFEGAINTTNILEARVLTSIAETFTGTPYANGIMRFKGGIATNYEVTGLTGSSKFPDAMSNVYLFGLYPENWTITNPAQATFVFTGKEDVMATEKVTTKQDDVVAGSYKVLSFKHLLTRLEVKLSAAVPAATALGDITSINLIGSKSNSTTPIKNTVLVANNVTPMTTTFSAAAVNTMPFYGMTFADDVKTFSDDVAANYVLTTDATFVGYSMVAPVEATAENKEEYFLEINSTLSAQPKRVAVDLMSSAQAEFVGNTAGRVFVISLYFKSDSEISVTVDVEDWDEQGEWQGEVSVN